jgi:hypothetical protein
MDTNSEILELKADELDAVSGGFVLVPRPPVGPAYPAPSPTGGVPPGGVDGGGGGGGSGFYNSGPYGDEDLHHLD